MRRRVRHVRDVRALAIRALGQGAQVNGPGVIRWDVAPHCLQPRFHAIEGRSAGWGRDPNQLNAKPDLSYVGDGMDDPFCVVEMQLRCRRCANCLKARSLEWSYRAKNEIHAASRTWFGTMTLRPGEHFLSSCRAEKKLRVGTRWADLSPDEQFKARHAEISNDITRWLKRVRKQSGAKLRYVLVAEAHKTGLPHYHILVHEQMSGPPVTERTLRRQWLLGHSKFELVENSGAAWYVAKYLAKAALARVRASRAYGQGIEGPKCPRENPAPQNVKF